MIQTSKFGQVPTFPLPLQPGDTEPLVDLQAIIHGLYDRAGFDMAIDYGQEPVPPLDETDRLWAEAVLQQQGLPEVGLE